MIRTRKPMTPWQKFKRNCNDLAACIVGLFLFTFGFVAAGIVFLVLAAIAIWPIIFWGVILFVALHFIGKFW